VKPRFNFSILALVVLIGAATVSCSSEKKAADPVVNSPSKVTLVPPVTGSVPTTQTAQTPAEKEQAAVVLPKNLQAAVNSSYRTVENTKRDRYRHPLETLKFFGLTPDMTVVEITPGAGWYTEILAPLLATDGHYIGAIPPVGENASQNEGNAKVIAWLKSHGEFNGHETIVDFHAPDKLELAASGTADMVVTFRNVHNWIAGGNQEAVFASFFKALKPGGILGIEEHRANPKTKRDPKASSGYVLEKDVIALAKKAGFTLVAKSEINANKKDTKVYPEGVWTLPPTLRLKDKDRETYLAIGESDRMTLKFMKPKAKK
jgi:predicted methyltransferase